MIGIKYIIKDVNDQNINPLSTTATLGIIARNIISYLFLLRIAAAIKTKFTTLPTNNWGPAIKKGTANTTDAHNAKYTL
jgi:hypothetical protein